MPRPLEIDDILKVGMYSLQCQTADGRAWEYAAIKFHCDDPRLLTVLRKARKPGAMVNPTHWRPIPRFGSLRHVRRAA
jgi:hypothetical protein